LREDVVDPPHWTARMGARRHNHAQNRSPQCHQLEH
jgi:hypothetical protein